MAYNKVLNTPKEKEVKYLNKDFNSFKNQLIEFTQTYFPENFNDFSEGNPGMMFLEMASYVGDVLSFYTDNQIQETFLSTAQDKESIYNLAYAMGYKPKVTSAASVNLDISQLVPSKIVGGSYEPDFNYALNIRTNSTFNSTEGATFYTTQDANFTYSSSLSTMNVSIFQYDASNNPEYYLLKKTIPAISAESKTQTFTIGEIERFKTLTLFDTNIISIESIIDSEGNEYTEVPYLAQDTVFENIANVQGNTTSLYEYHIETPYLLKIKQVPRRFVTRFTSDNILEIQFGSGDSSKTDEEILPIPDNIGLGGKDGRSKLDQSIDPSNFLHSQTYGKAPSNTTLTVTYLKGGGIRSNVLSQTINQISTLTVDNKPNLNGNLLEFCKESLACTNPEPATGGGSGDNTEDIRLNTISNFATQQRIVTKEDYIVRTLSKAYVVKSSELEMNTTSGESSQISSNLYILGYNNDKKLSNCNTATKTNLATYLNYYKPLTDSINIMDAFIINFGIDFEITTFRNNSNQQVLLDCITELKDYFNVEKWEINQPIIESEVYNLIGNVKGVQSVINVTFNNLAGRETGYSRFRYDFKTATRNGIIYPSLDPSIFELKYPDTDIIGKIKQY